MGEINKFCPSCGKELEADGEFCANCGFKMSGETQINQSTTKSYNTGSSSWPKYENLVALAGEFSWILMILYIIVTIIAMVWFYSAVAWNLISLVAVIAISAIFLKDFAERCKKKDWYYLVNDVFIIGEYRIPKMLVYSAILSIFTDAWGSSLIIIVALMVLFLGPEEVVWKTSDKSQ